MEAAGLGDIVLLDEMTSLERIYKAIKAASSDERMKEFFNNHLSDMKVIDLCINKIESVDLDIAFTGNVLCKFLVFCDQLFQPNACRRITALIAFGKFLQRHFLL